MNKAPLPGTPEDLWRRRAAEKLTHFTLYGGLIRGAYVQANMVVEEMAQSHQLGPFETYFLGQAYVAALLMASTLKGEDRLNLKVNTNGPLGGFTVDANAYGEVRGYLFENPIRIPTAWKEAPFSELWGTGTLSVTYTREGKRVPVTGTVAFDQRSLARGLVHYFDQSEQTSTALDLSLPFAEGGKSLAAAGLLIQALPGCPDSVWNSMAERLNQLPSIGENAEQSHSAKALLDFWFNDASPKILGNRTVEFFCPCSKERFQNVLQGFSAEEKADILEKGPFPLETTCANCSSVYRFTRDELAQIFES